MLGDANSEGLGTCAVESRNSVYFRGIFLKMKASGQVWPRIIHILMMMKYVLFNFIPEIQSFYLSCM